MQNQRLEMEMEKEIKNRVNSLPKVIRDIIDSEDWKQWVGHISKKNTLNLDQAATLEHLVLLFMIGMLSKTDLRSYIEDEMKPGVAKTNSIIVDVNDYIIEPLKKKLIDETVFGIKPEVKHAEDKVPIFNSYKNTLEHRDEILAEIEKPSMHNTNIGVRVNPTVDKIINKVPEIKAVESVVEKLPENLPMVAPEQEAVKLSEVPQVSIMEKKLGIKALGNSLEVLEKPTESIAKPKTYTADPYREIPN